MEKKSEDLDDLYFGSYIMSDAVGSDYFPCDKYETILQVFEPFIWTYGDASSVMLSSLLLILLFADMPFISQATPYWLVRTKRKIWLAGQIIYVILATVIY